MDNEEKKCFRDIKMALRKLSEIGVPVTPIIKAVMNAESELAESEDERIRKAIRLILIATEDEQKDFYSTHGLTRKDCTDWLDERHIEQKPDIELIQRSWYMEGYHDAEFKREPKWILKIGEGGPRHELNPRYGEPLAEQKPIEFKLLSSGSGAMGTTPPTFKLDVKPAWRIQDEMSRKWILEYLYDGLRKSDEQFKDHFKSAISYLEKKKEQEQLSTEETELNSIAFLEQLGYTCIHPGKEQKPVNPLDRGDEIIFTDICDYFKATGAPGWAARITDWFYLAKNAQRPAEWSEDIIRKSVKEVGLTQHQIDWFKTNVFPPKQEWGEEDDDFVNYFERLLDFGYEKDPNGFGKLCQGAKQWLGYRIKSLRPHWKPSEEQMKAMEEVRTIFHHHHLWDEINPFVYDYEELMRDLQKLM